MDVKNVYVHEKLMYTKPLYMREMSRSEGIFTHGRTVGRLRKNLWGGDYTGFYFFDPLFSYLTEHGYTATDKDACISIKQTTKDAP